MCLRAPMILLSTLSIMLGKILFISSCYYIETGIALRHFNYPCNYTTMFMITGVLMCFTGIFGVMTCLENKTIRLANLVMLVLLIIVLIVNQTTLYSKIKYLPENKEESQNKKMIANFVIPDPSKEGQVGALKLINMFWICILFSVVLFLIVLMKHYICNFNEVVSEGYGVE